MANTVVQQKDLIDEIAQLKTQHDAVILAHNYQPGPVQDIADFVGDSLAMARWAQNQRARQLVIAGVYFMAETAAILCPKKTILLPDLQAGCSLADSITPEDLIAWRREHPPAVVVSYVNTSAEIKALSDYCCTSSNAVSVVESIPADQEVLFLPDFYLGSYVARATKRSNIRVWMGECHVHAAIDAESMADKSKRFPNAEVLVHPECGCTTRALALPLDGVDMHILSTDSMLTRARSSTSQTFIIATEIGLLHRLRQESPNKQFVAAQENALCPFMNLISLEKIRDSLLYQKHPITIPEPIRRRAILPLERMVSIGGR